MNFRELKFLTVAAVVALGLTVAGCGGGDDDDDTAMMDEPVVTEPAPEPEPPTPTDLEETQSAAAAAATAAMTASTNAETAAAGAETATANIATLQTGEMAKMNAMDARMYADMAMDEYMKAKAASEAAAAATTGPATEAAWRDAENAKDAAEAAAETAAEKAEAAIEAAKSELHIDGTMKMVGDGDDKSSLDASSGMLTKTAADGSKTITGFVKPLTRENSGNVDGQPFVHETPAANDKAYMQAVEARDLTIGKTVDTTDDMARVTVVTGRAGSETYRVFADAGTANTDPYAVDADGKVDVSGTTENAADDVRLKSLGMFIKATPAEPAPETGAETDALDYTDIVHAKAGATATVRAAPTAKDNKPVEVFSYGSGDSTMYVVVVDRLVKAGVTTEITLQPVSITAVAAPDSSRDTETNDAHERVGVTAAVPMTVDYDHIHFGVWAALGTANKAGVQRLADLGIGFVQNIGEGVTEKQGIGTATYTGDWVAVIQRQNSTAAGPFTTYDGKAKLTANFDKDEFEADLTNLAMLEGTLDGNGFSGMTAKGIMHPDLNKTGKFTGEFSGNIYGAKGEEAAGVFDFDGGEAGAFRGAFGGTNQK